MDYRPEKYSLISKLSETRLDVNLSPLYVEQIDLYVQQYDSKDECWQYFINNGTDYLLKSNRRLVTRNFKRVGNGFNLIHYFSPRYSTCDECELNTVKFHIKKDIITYKLSNGKILCLVN